MKLQRAALALVMAGALSAAMASSSAHAHPPGVAEADQAAAHEIEAFREALVRAIERKDVARLRVMYADDFIHTHGSGKVDGKDTRIVSVLAGDPVIENASVEEVRYRVYGSHAVIVTGKSPILNKAENRTYQFRWISVYAKVGADWKLVASQATRLP